MDPHDPEWRPTSVASTTEGTCFRPTFSRDERRDDLAARWIEIRTRGGTAWACCALLRTDDSEVSKLDPAIPRAPRAQVFQRSIGPRAPESRAAYPAHYAPPSAAPSSLSPVALTALSGPDRSEPRREPEPLVIRSRPSITMGLSMLLAGAVVGGLIGVAMHHQRGPDAALAAQPPLAQETAPLPSVSAAAATHPPSPVAVVPSLSVSPVVLPPSGGVVVAPPTTPPTREVKEPRRTAPHPVAVTRAANGPGPSSAPKANVPRDKKEKEAAALGSASYGNGSKEPSLAAREPKEPRSAAKKSETKRSDDANAILKAAMGATENTL